MRFGAVASPAGPTVPCGPLAPLSAGDSAVAADFPVLMDVRCSDPVPANATPDAINAQTSEITLVAFMTGLLAIRESD